MEQYFEYIGIYQKLENEFPDELWLDRKIFKKQYTNKMHLNMQLLKIEKPKPYVPKPKLYKECNICNENKELKNDMEIICKGCKNGFICQDCTWEYIRNLPIENKEPDCLADYYCNDVHIPCALCRKIHYLCY